METNQRESGNRTEVVAFRTVFHLRNDHRPWQRDTRLTKVTELIEYRQNDEGPHTRRS